jgi:hypothetical protein
MQLFPLVSISAHTHRHLRLAAQAGEKEARAQADVLSYWSCNAVRYDVVDGHERLETHRTVGKCVLQVRKGVATPAAEGQEEDGEDDADEEQDLNDMVLDKV